MSDKTPYNPEAFWFSKLNDYRTCPKLYEAKHIHGIVPEEKGLDSEFGSALHYGIAECLSGRDGVEGFQMYWSTVDKRLRKFKFGPDALEKMGPIFIERFARLHAKHFKPFRIEERIYTKFDQHLVEGTPDFLGEYKGVPSIVDFKTSSAKYAKEKIECEEQLSAYGEMSARELGYTPEQRVYVVFVKDFNDPSIQILKSELTYVVRSSTLENMKATIEEIKARKQYPMNTLSCVRGSIVCPNFANCWRSNEQSVLDPNSTNSLRTGAKRRAG